jgi:ketosteroid isomerase-like protein
MATTTKTAPRAGKAQANKTALRDAIAALSAGSAEQYLALFAPDARLHGFPMGIDDVESLAQFHSATADLYPGASVTLDDTVAERDRVATRFTWRASQAPGLELVAQGGAIVRFADGRIAECWNLTADLAAVVAEDNAA